MKYKEAPEGYKYLTVESGRYKTMLTSKYMSREKYVPLDPKKVYSVIPGTIREITVKKGSKVKEGEIIFVLEAMKMMNNVMAPANGIVKVINVEPGTIVPRGHMLIEFE